MKASDGQLSRELWRKLAMLGVLSAGAGDGEAGPMEASAAAFELGRVASPGPLVEAAVAAQLFHGSVRERILSGELHLDPRATPRFSMALSEACQNVVEHAEAGGWVAVHAYNWRKRLGRRVVVIAGSDAGIGFKASLGPTEAPKHGDRWSDAVALEAALIHSVFPLRPLLIL